MLWWLVDNATLVYIVLGLAALALALRWRLTRRSNYLLGLAIVAALVALVVVLSLTVVTDRKRLVQTVEAVARQMNEKNFEAAFRHFTDEIHLEMSGQSGKVRRKPLQELARLTFQNRNIPGIEIWDVEVESVERPQAVVSFYLRPSGQQGYAVCRAKFVLVGENDWRVQGLKIELPANWQVPFPRGLLGARPLPALASGGAPLQSFIAAIATLSSSPAAPRG